MKYSTVAIALVGAVAAMPQGKPIGKTITQTIAGLTDANGNLDGGNRPLVRDDIIDNTPCGRISFIFARASSEPTNMGGSVGPLVCAGLKRAYGDNTVLCQGVGGAYKAAITDNIGAKGTSAAAIREGTQMFTRSVQKCPQHAIVFGGYSQGTAVMHNVVGNLPQSIKQQVVAGVLFGDTKNKQDRGQVPNYPKDNVRIYCDADDGVCKGSLNVTNGHFVYPLNGDVERALAFLTGKIDQAIGGGR